MTAGFDMFDMYDDVFDSCLQVMTACFAMFGTWDDEFDKLQGLLRDIVKKKREEHLKMVWRVSPAHRRLQARLDQMRTYVLIMLVPCIVVQTDVT